MERLQEERQGAGACSGGQMRRPPEPCALLPCRAASWFSTGSVFSLFYSLTPTPLVLLQPMEPPKPAAGPGSANPSLPAWAVPKKVRAGRASRQAAPPREQGGCLAPELAAR